MAYGIAAQLTLLTFTRCLVEYYPALGRVDDGLGCVYYSRLA